jgi:hypothetical protein
LDRPEAQDLAGKPILEQALTRFKAISNTGGEVLGERDPAIDGLVARDPNDLSIGASHEVWGWETIRIRADELLDSRSTPLSVCSEQLRSSHGGAPNP